MYECNRCSGSAPGWKLCQRACLKRRRKLTCELQVHIVALPAMGLEAQLPRYVLPLLHLDGHLQHAPQLEPAGFSEEGFSSKNDNHSTFSGPQQRGSQQMDRCASKRLITLGREGFDMCYSRPAGSGMFPSGDCCPWLLLRSTVLSRWSLGTPVRGGLPRRGAEPALHGGAIKQHVKPAPNNENKYSD